MSGHGDATKRYEDYEREMRPWRLLPRRVEEQDQIIAELRAILAPSLDAPLTTGNGTTLGYCFFCQNLVQGGAGHALSCPVLRRDALLGREATT